MIEITIITVEGCHTCKEAKDLLNKLKSDYELKIEEIDADSDEGQEIVKEHGIRSAPAIFVNDELFSSGHVTEDELKHAFDTAQE